MTRARKIILIVLLVILVVLVAFCARYLVNRFCYKAPVEQATAVTPPSAEAAQPGVELVPNFTVYNDAGEEVTLHDYIGKPIVVNFWATWCPPCKSELPTFNEAYATYGDKVEFLMVDLTDGNMETVDGVKAFVAENGYDFPVYYDTMSSAGMAYSISAIPVTVMIDENGELVRSFTGAISETVLTNSIERMID